jgi:hypothetical protein
MRRPHRRPLQSRFRHADRRPCSIADALLDRETLSGDEIHALLDREDLAVQARFRADCEALLARGISEGEYRAAGERARQARRRPVVRRDLAGAALDVVVDALARGEPVGLDELRSVLVLRADQAGLPAHEIAARLDTLVERRRPAFIPRSAGGACHQK